MFYKHWKKIVLALTGIFWASCDNTSSSAEDDPQVSPALYGIEVPCDTGLCSSIPVSSEENDEESSSSFVETSSSFEESSSSFEVPVPTYGCGAIECPPSLDLSSSSSIEAYSSSSEALSYSSFSAVYAPQTPCNLTDTAATCDFDSLFSSKSSEYTNKIYAISCKQYKCDSKTCTEATAQVDSEHNPPSECNENGCVDYSLLSSTQKKYTCSDGKTYDQIEFNTRYRINEDKN
ncbi:hypothetical protein [uncultured Fibrobacter sp.]|uniref:hypothetical protein n=1 Tax=uncultured Fibrobacter sp. TaxID=261512 RepID=UPI0025DD1C36|nr:hypothetical protein [uncultured Fibrobacter sp.]